MQAFKVRPTTINKLKFTDTKKWISIVHFHNNTTAVAVNIKMEPYIVW